MGTVEAAVSALVRAAIRKMRDIEHVRLRGERLKLPGMRRGGVRTLLSAGPGDEWSVEKGTFLTVLNHDLPSGLPKGAPQRPSVSCRKAAACSHSETYCQWQFHCLLRALPGRAAQVRAVNASRGKKVKSDNCKISRKKNLGVAEDR